MSLMKVKKEEFKKKSIKELVDEIPTSSYVKGVSIIEEISLGNFEFTSRMCVPVPERRIRFKVLFHYTLNCEAGVWYFNSYEGALKFVKTYCLKNNIHLGALLHE